MYQITVSLTKAAVSGMLNGDGVLCGCAVLCVATAVQ
jgi:hypothetical protein